MSTLSKNEIERLSRQILVRGWGMKAQQGLMNASVFISPALPFTIRYLQSAGARLTLERQEISNGILHFAIVSECDPPFSTHPECRLFTCARDGQVTDGQGQKVHASQPPLLSSSARMQNRDDIPLSAQLFCALLLMKQFSSPVLPSKPSLVLPYCRHGKE